MKKIILTLTLILAAINLMAQEHLSFKGIPIDGNVTEFCRQLRAKGFRYIWTSENNRQLTGPFINDDDMVTVVTMINSKTVAGVSVMLYPYFRETWSELVDSYDTIKSFYITKYGNPTYSIEENPTDSDMNSILMTNLHDGKAKYESKWIVPGGTITLNIGKGDISGRGCIFIFYADKSNIGNSAKETLENI